MHKRLISPEIGDIGPPRVTDVLPETSGDTAALNMQWRPLRSGTR